MIGPAERRLRPFLSVTVAACILVSGCRFPDDNGAATGSRGLWVVNGATVIEYVPSQFVAGASTAAPRRVLHSAALGSPTGVTFDLSGNMWVLDPLGKTGSKPTAALFEFSAAQLAALPTTDTIDPVATITAASLTSPQQMWIDSTGNGWVTDHDTSSIVVFEQAQLGQTGANFFEPPLIIMSGDFDGPAGIAFDSAGDLWIANNGNVKPASGAAGPAGTTLVGIKSTNVPAIPLGLRAIPTVSADFTLKDDGQGSVHSPFSLAFDVSGNLWSSNVDSSTVVAFAPSALTASGSPAPAVTLSSTSVGGVQSLQAPRGICFDDVGNLAVVDSGGSFGVAFYGEKQLVTAAPAPDTFLTGAATTLSSPQGCAFGTRVE